MSERLNAFRLSRFRVQPVWKWLAAAIILALLLAEYLLPARLASQGVSRLIYLVGLAVAVVALPRPWIGLTVLMAYGPFAAAVRFGGASNIESLAKDVFALAVVAFWLVRWMLKREKWVRTPLDVPLALFLSLLLIQTLRGPSLLRAILALKILATYIPIYFLVVNNPPNPAQLKRILWVLMAVSAITALYGLYQSRTLTGTAIRQIAIEGQHIVLSVREGRTRALSTFTHSTVFSAYLSLMITLGLGLLAMARRQRVGLILVIGLLVAALPPTLSRIGWIGAVIGVAVFFAFMSRQSLRIWFLLLGILAALTLLVTSDPAANSTLSWSFTDEDMSFQQRQLFLGWTYNTLIFEVPQGCGLGVLPDAADLATRLSGSLQPPYLCAVSGGKYMQSADTLILAVAAQTGVLGYALYVWVLVVLWRGGVRAYQRINSLELKMLAASLLGYLAIMTFSTFFSSSTQGYPIVDLYFWFFAGLLMSLERIDQYWQKQDGQVETFSGH